MEMKKVKSSNIDSVGYDADKKELHVAFKGSSNKKVYVYKGVEADKAKRFAESESLGKFLGKEIKGKHEFEMRKPPEIDEKQENKQTC